MAAKLSIVTSGFQTISKTDEFTVLKAQFVLFELLVRADNVYLYFHTWYKRYCNAFIAYLKVPVLSAEFCNVIDHLCHDYENGNPRAVLSVMDIDHLASYLKESGDLSQIRDFLIGKQLLCEYRIYNDNKTPSIITKFDIIPLATKIIYPKPGVKIPKPLLPGSIDVKTKKKLSLTEFIKRGDRDEHVGSL